MNWYSNGNLRDLNGFEWISRISRDTNSPTSINHNGDILERLMEDMGILLGDGDG